MVEGDSRIRLAASLLHQPFQHGMEILGPVRHTVAVLFGSAQLVPAREGDWGSPPHMG